MPLDAICLQGVVGELAPQLTGSRIEKIQQPARDQIILLLRGSRRLFLNAGANQPRIHLTEQLRDNPSQPPMFCMLLRKHLSGGIIESVRQEPLERVVTLTVLASDEMGERSRFTLVWEGMPRRANLILCDRDGRIIDCLRRVDLEAEQDRQVLPGLFYRLPTRQDKRSPLSVTEEEFAALLGRAAPDAPLDDWLLDTFTAISPLVARELTVRACGSTDAPVSQENTLWDVFSRWQRDVNENTFTPTLIKRNGSLADFTYGPVTQYGTYAETEIYDSFSHLLDDFYEKREQAERVKQKGRDLLKTATTARDRVRRKLAAQEKELAACLDRDHLRICGELITANLYRMERGQSRLTAQNYYDENCADVDIPLDVRLSPQENAARYFKQYAKAKTAEKYLTAQLQRGREELQYLESVLQELSQAETEQEFNEIRRELQETNYLKKSSGGKKELKRAFAPRTFKTSSGLEVLVGRSNVQNDQLTKKADKRDYWFHTQHIHGSHVILRCAGLTPSDDDLREAAMLASYFSQAKESSSVPVDYCPVKFVKKPAGARPGMVTYDNYRTLYVTPEEGLAKKLFIR